MILIDVRKRGELTRDGKIPGSFNIPLIEIEKAFKMTNIDFKHKRIKEAKQSTAIMATDLCSAFHTVDHKTLIKKLFC